MPLEMSEMNSLFNKTFISFILCCLGLFLMKITLLLIRWYDSLIPVYITAGLIAIFSFYVAFKVHHIFATTPSINRLLITV